MNSKECFGRANWESILNFIVFGAEPAECSQSEKDGLLERIMRHENNLNSCIRSMLQEKVSEQELEECLETAISEYGKLEILNMQLGLKVGFLLVNKLERF